MAHLGLGKGEMCSWCWVGNEWHIGVPKKDPKKIQKVEHMLFFPGSHRTHVLSLSHSLSLSREFSCHLILFSLFATRPAYSRLHMRLLGASRWWSFSLDRSLRTPMGRGRHFQRCPTSTSWSHTRKCQWAKARRAQRFYPQSNVARLEIFFIMWVKQCHKPSRSHHHFYWWYKMGFNPFPVMGGTHDIVLPTLLIRLLIHIITIKNN